MKISQKRISLSKSGRPITQCFLYSIFLYLAQPVCENSVYQISHITVKRMYLLYNALATSFGQLRSHNHATRELYGNNDNNVAFDWDRQSRCIQSH